MESRNKELHRIDFTQSGFDNQIYRNSAQMRLERSMLCACRNMQTGYVPTICPFCKGTGYLFTAPVDIYGMITNLNYQQTLQMNFTEINATANLTISEAFDFRLKYFDKLTILDGDGIIQNQLSKFYLKENPQRKQILQAETQFQINKIEYCLIYQSLDKIKQLVLGVDYTFVGNIITLSDIFRAELLKSGETEFQCSIRYYHKPIYHVMRDEHAIRMTRIIKNDIETVELLPLQYMIREASYFVENGQSINSL